ncbi:lipopolysaccharide export system permease protein [Aquimarina amphilecti]|uniref:Lipopolysaccharide export system permease protein n=2 Tax=Aquimarina amphilecti TaxID=1038014 RepID=A0A1H7FNA1_AQUAM|nr:lipopolysaccharide export system permease protein [Aquimarina amphilecti]
MFILLLQTIWLFISELAGKDLDFAVIIKFLTYATPRLIPMVLPLTILLTSIMIFGNFAENYEFAAMKSSGISLQRAMRTLAVFIFFVGIGAFLFSNTVIPSSERKFVNLRKNIVKVKPAMVITPNQFNDLGDINIRVSEKYGDNDQFLKDVIIHKKGARLGNFTVIKATDGELQGSIDSDLITLILNDGNYYEEVQPKSPKKKKKLPFAKTHFKQYALNIDLSSLDNVDMDAQQYSKGYNMLNVNGLREQIDTLSIQVNDEINATEDDVNRRNGFKELNRNLKIDTLKKATKDTLDLIEDRFNTKQKSQIYNLAFSNADGVIRRIQTAKRSLEVKKRALNKYEMSLHDKYALGIACVLLFFVGAPLGAIIRKGGLGLPIVIGVVLFLTYHFIGIFAKNGAEEGGVPPFVGSWLSTFIIFPLSIFLTYRATRDRGLASFDIVVQPIRDFFNKRSNKKDRINSSSIDQEINIEIGQNTLVEVEKDRTNFKENSSLVFTLFLLLLIVNIVITLISKDAGGNKTMLLVFNGLGGVSYLTFFIKSYFNLKNFYTKLKGLINEPSLILFLILGIPLFPIVYFFYNNRVNKDLKKIR